MSETPGWQEPVLDNEGNASTVVQPTPGSEHNAYAPNMCDRCCWYPGALQVTDEQLTDDGNQITYHSVNDYWIDLKHGRVFKEDKVLAATPAYAVSIEVSTDGGSTWVPKTENPWGQTTGDYTVDYESGDIVFNSALGVGDLVQASYYYADSYVFYLQPDAGKMLKVIYAEVQYSENIRFNANVNFAIEVYIDPQNPPLGRVEMTSYSFKRLRNFYEESIGPYPVMPAHGGEAEVVEITGTTNIQAKLDEGYTVLGTRYDADWIALMHGIKANGNRAMQFKLLTVPFHYNAFVPLYSVLGMRIKITLENNTPLGGTFGNITFYCLSEDNTTGP
jgi:hypothetical protein